MSGTLKRLLITFHAYLLYNVMHPRMHYLINECTRYMYIVCNTVCINRGILYSNNSKCAVIYATRVMYDITLTHSALNQKMEFPIHHIYPIYQLIIFRQAEFSEVGISNILYPWRLHNDDHRTSLRLNRTNGLHCTYLVSKWQIFILLYFYLKKKVFLII